MAREKRTRLYAGKGVKKNGVYARDDPDPVRRLHRAASFESLPPGPDPHSIAKDVHAPGLLPRLTKKATIFRASKETIEARQKEFAALIEALLREDDNVPTLIMELRELRIVRDFFGFWRRDHDRLIKQSELSSKSARNSTDSFTSRASGLFSSSGSGFYFSASNISLQLPSPNVLPHDSATGVKGPRKPAFMQGITLMPPASPSSPTYSNDSSQSSGTGRRPRAQTLENPSSPNSASRPAYATHGRGASLDIPGRTAKLPASAPAGSTFSRSNLPSSATSPEMSRVKNGSSSDECDNERGYASDISASDRGYASPMASPRRRNVNVNGTPEKGNDRESMHSLHGPIIVSLQEGEMLSLLGDETGFDFRDVGSGGRDGTEHAHLIPREGARGLQDLTIREEDESESGEETETEGDGSGHSDENAAAYWSTSAPLPGHGARSSLISTSTDTVRGVRRTAGFSSRPIDFDAQSIASVATGDSHGSTASGESTNGSGRTPLSSARAAAAHADALRALTGGSVTSPAPSGPRVFNRDSTASYASEPSIVSGTELDFDVGGFSESMILYADGDELNEEDEDEATLYARMNGLSDCDDKESHQRRQRPHDSLASVRTFMTTDSANAILPPQIRPASSLRRSNALGGSMRRRSPLSRAVRDSAVLGMGIQRPASANSNLTMRFSTLTIQDGTETDLLDTYFSGMTLHTSSFDADSPTNSGSNSSSRSPTLHSSSQSRQAPQSRLPFYHDHPHSPGLPESISARNSVISTFSIPPATPMLAENAQAAQRFVEYGPVRTSIYPDRESVVSQDKDQDQESVYSARSDESFGTMGSGSSPISQSSTFNGMNGHGQTQNHQLAIKAVWNDNIVAFRVDRAISLSSLRTKIRSKLLPSPTSSPNTDTSSQLPENFMLGFKAPSAGRVQTLRSMGINGRARSSSLSSNVDPGALRVLFTEKDWEEIVRMNGIGTKLTLHVLDK